MRINIALVGLGQVVCGNNSIAGVHMNHLSAILSNEEFLIVGLFDTDSETYAKANHILGSSSDNVIMAASLEKLPSELADVIVIGTPTETHLEIVKLALSKKPRLIILEKPMALSFYEAQLINKLVNDAGVVLRVNFRREFDTGHMDIRKHFDKMPVKILARYSGGLFNYSSHLVDLLLSWVGHIKTVRAISKPEGDSTDPLISYLCETESGVEAIFIGMSGVDYDQCEFDLFFSDMRIELSNGGVEKRFYYAEPDLYYEGYTQLKENRKDVNAVGGYLGLYQSVGNYLNRNITMSGCDGERALEGMAVLNAALLSSKNNFQIIHTNEFLH